MNRLLLHSALVLAAGLMASSCGHNESAPDSGACVIENIMTRTSVRQFTDEAVGADTVETLLRAGMAAPTAKNLQPWAFAVISGRSVLDSLQAVSPYARLETAPLAIVVCGDMNKAADGGAGEFWVQDCSAATENILLAAHALGLGAVWCGGYPDSARVEGIRRVLGLPANLVPLNIISLGHPAVNPEPKDKWKPENVLYIRR